jgi:hypothetical protein
MTRLSRMRSPALAIASAAISVLGCALGSLVAEILVIVRAGAPLGTVLSNLSAVFHFYPKAVGALGFLFWALAAFYGYRVAMGMSVGRRYGRMRRMGGRQTGGQMQPGQPYGTPGQQPYGMPGQEPYGTPPGQPYGTPQDQPPYGTPPPPTG